MRYKWALKQLFLFLALTFLIFFTISNLFTSSENDIEYEDNFNLTQNELYVEEFLKMTQLRTAPVRPVVEKEADIQENYWCFFNSPKNVEKSKKWTKMAGIEVFSAYYDDRINSLFSNNNAVQILVMSNHTIEGKFTFFCNIFNSKSQNYATTRGYIREIWQRAWDPRGQFQMPSLITCPIPKRIDRGGDGWVVSLSRNRCKSQEVGVEVIGKPKIDEAEKMDVAVCVKGLDYQEDISGRILEWIELNYVLGADTISIYSYFLTPQTLKVIEFYKQKMGGKFKFTQISLSGSDPNDPIERSKFLKNNRPQKRRHELIPYNDCFYSHIHTHKYVLILDIDEVIVPILASNYTQMLRKMENYYSNRQFSSISARNVFKFQSNFSVKYPQHNYMISNRKRSKKISVMGEFGKSFSSTKTVATVFNHFGLHKTSKSIAKTIYIPPREGIKLHYKSECPTEVQKECHQLQFDLINDTSLDKFEHVLKQRVQSNYDAIFS